jgi:hypothetical protein
VDQIDVEEGGAQHIDDEELQSGGGGVEQNNDPGGSHDGVEVEALLDGYSLGARCRRNATTMEAQRGHGGTSLSDGSLGHGGAPSRWRRSSGAITAGALSRWRRNRGGVKVEARQPAAQQMTTKP